MIKLEQHNPEGNSEWNKEDIKKETKKLLDDVYEYSKRIYAEGKQSVLIVLQGMDASGKDGLTRSLFQKVSPSWVNVHSFKKPTDEEFAHDFLWRIHKCTPAKGMITVFNRSHYEDILVPSVYGYIDDSEIKKRYAQINAFEEHLEANGTRIIKCYLNVGKEKQEEKLLERINTAEKHWKHSDGDWETRAHWDEFMSVYESILNTCDTIPWHIIPCNHNWVKLYSAAKILVEELKNMDPKFPALESEKFVPDYSKSKYRY